MVDFYDDRGVVALLDRPSSKSFGMCPLIVKHKDNEFYEVLGLSSGVQIIPLKKFGSYGEHILKVESQLPKGLSNPVALWLGYQFCVKAKELGTPSPPKTDETWHSPLEPHQERGKYKIKSCSEAYGVLDEWVTAAGTEALIKNNHDFARLMNWVLPLSPVTQAVLYFTAPTDEDKQRELKWQLRIQDPNAKTTLSDLIKQYEETRSQLLS